jgi:hypothetical protein
MRKGDISNELPKRVIVTTDVFLKVNISVKKKYKVFSTTEKTKSVRRDILSRLYLFTTNRGVTLELASFDMNEEELSVFIDRLDNMGTNPFRYFTAYESVNHLVQELPYRPEVIGVLDTPDKLLRYGHWGLDGSIL